MSVFRIKSLTLENFVVFKDKIEIPFSSDLINNIEGGHSNNEDQSNGIGKSLLICAISCALFGKGIRFQYLHDYITPSNLTGGIYVGLELEDNNGHILKIERWRRPGSDVTKAKVWYDGKAVSQDSTTSKADDLISSYIGTTYSNFINCIFSVMIVGFMKLKPSQRFEVLENALAVKKMDTIVRKINAVLKTDTESLDGIQEALKDSETKLSKETAKLEIYTNNTDSLKQSIKNHSDELTDHYTKEAELSSKRDEVITLLTEIESREGVLISEMLEEKAIINSILDSKKVLEKRLSLVHKTFRKRNGTVECSVCKSLLDTDSESKVTEHYQIEISELNSKMEALAEKLSLLEVKRSSVLDKKSKILKSKNRLDSELKIEQGTIIGLENSVSRAKHELSQAETSINTAFLDELKKEVTQLTDKKLALKKNVKIVSSWKQALSKNGLRLSYIKEEIDTLGTISSKFATACCNEPKEIKFFINDERDNPSIDFTANGKSAGAFSTGEARILEIAMTLSLFTLLKTSGMNLGFLILDEAMDGLSVASKQNILGVIDDLAKEYQIISISHDAMVKSRPGNIIKITKDIVTELSTVTILTR